MLYIYNSTARCTSLDTFTLGRGDMMWGYIVLYIDVIVVYSHVPRLQLM